MLNYNIKGTGLEVSEELRAYATRQLEKVEKFLEGDATAHADIELEYDQKRDPSSAKATQGKGGKYRAEFTISATGALYRAQEWGSTMHEAIDLAGSELFRELRRAKRKRFHVFRRGALKVKEYVRGWRDRF